MGKGYRRSGIEAAAEAPWGTHLCLLYHTQDDLIDILVPYFKAGLEDNECCMWVTSEPLGVEDARRSLESAAGNLDNYVQKGQLEILDFRQWYTRSGRFEADEVLRGWVEKEQQALERGFDGLRLTGNTFWLERKDWQRFVDYEATVDRVIGEHRMIAVCSYSLDRCGASELVDVVSNHEFALLRRGGEWEAIGSAERKRAEKEAMDLARFPSENPDPVARIGKDGRVLYANAAAQPLLSELGSGEGQLAPHRWRELVSETLSARAATSHEVEHAGRLFSLHVVPVSEAGYVNWYGSDVTERRRAEEAARAADQRLLDQQRRAKEQVAAELAEARDELVRKTRLAAIGQISASIAHDLRNPLGAARNAIYYIKNRLARDDPKLKEYVGIIDSEIGSADHIIGALLEMARGRAPAKRAVDLGQLVGEVLAAAREAKEIRCRVALTPDPFLVHADPGQLRQVVANLLTNAAEAMEGQGEWIVEAVRDQETDIILFRDTGQGIPPEVRENLFEPLVTTRAAGTGLGLTICRQIVERHGGTIDAVDHEGEGAAFRVRLPRDRRHEPSD